MPKGYHNVNSAKKMLRHGAWEGMGAFARNRPKRVTDITGHGGESPPPTGIDKKST